jgi:hypothetical protein
VRAPQSPPHADPGPAVALVREVRRLVRGDSGDGWCVGSLQRGRGRCCWAGSLLTGTVRCAVRRELYCELVAELEAMYFRSPWPPALEQLLRWEFGGPWEGLLKEEPWVAWRAARWSV